MLPCCFKCFRVNKKHCILGLLVFGIVFATTTPSSVNAGCKLPGNDHEDNHPSSKEGAKLIERGASYCEIAQKCDAMQIDIKIDNIKELHATYMYQGAPHDVQKDLDEYAKDGHGHDNPNIVCYELERSVIENN